MSLGIRWSVVLSSPAEISPVSGSLGYALGRVLAPGRRRGAPVVDGTTAGLAIDTEDSVAIIPGVVASAAHHVAGAIHRLNKVVIATVKEGESGHRAVGW